MKMIFSSRAKTLFRVFLYTFIFVFALSNLIGYLFDIKNLSIFAASAQVDKFEIRSRLLMQATDEIGVCSPEKAARVWASGLKGRSAALQYSVMTKPLKNDYARQLEQTFPNWVTGVSSPWVDKYEITKTEKLDGDTYRYCFLISTKTSAGPAGNYNAVLMVTREGDFWRITKLNTDKELSIYTGFQP